MQINEKPTFKKLIIRLVIFSLLYIVTIYSARYFIPKYETLFGFVFCVLVIFYVIFERVLSYRKSMNKDEIKRNNK
jgi:hypothetical protein